MPGIEAVVFDIGNVLIEWQPERFYDSAIGPDRRKALFAEIDLHGMNDRVDRGENFRDVVYATADQCPGWRSEIRMWHDNWINMAAPAIDHSVILLRALRSNDIPVFALTNFGIQTFDYATTHYTFLDEFDRRYISGHMKVIKPDAAIYQGLEDDCGIMQERLLFTDDRLENIEMAQQRGWQVHLFEGPAGWAQRLVDEELLSRAEAGL